MITASDEIEAADWLMGSLFPFHKYEAGSIVPPTYEAYARVLHPAQGPSGSVSWAEIANWSGRVYHSAMQFERIATPIQGKGRSAKPWIDPAAYTLPMHQAKSLANLLASFTTTSDHVWYLVWDGHGDVPPTCRQRVRGWERNYLLYRGAIGDIGGGRISEHHRDAPEYWFPDDKSWCVATDMDLFWTYVGGSRACIDAVLNSPDLEAVPATLHDGLTIESDVVNRPSDEEQS